MLQLLYVDKLNSLFYPQILKVFLDHKAKTQLIFIRVFMPILHCYFRCAGMLYLNLTYPLMTNL